MYHKQSSTDDKEHHLRELEQKLILLFELEKDFAIKMHELEISNEQLKNEIRLKSMDYKELEQEKFIQTEMNKLNSDNSLELKVTKQNLQKIMHEKSVMTKELEQEKLLVNEIHETMANKISTLEESNNELNKKLYQQSINVKESEQEKIFLDGISKDEIAKTNAIGKKYYLTIAMAGVILAGIIIPYSVLGTITGEEYKVQMVKPMASGYTIQNLRGDAIDTWLSWRLAKGDTLHINILNSEKYDAEIIGAIKKTILSDEIIEIDNSLLFKGPKGTTELYYIGWKGALEKAAESDTKSYIPSKIEVLESATGEGDITIELVNYSNADGFAGWTNSIADDAQNQILKARITIFDADKLTPTKMGTVLRHELGHAFGLAHTEASEDLMAPVITTEFPYISSCDVDAITSLYDGGNLSKVVCEI